MTLFKMDCSYFGLMVMTSDPKWICSVCNRPVQHLQFVKSIGAFQRPIPVFSPQACLSVSLTTQWLSLFTQLHRSDRTAAARPPLPSGHWEIYDSRQTIYIQRFICDFVCVYLHTLTAGLHSGCSNCHSMYFACGCVKLSHSLWPSEPGILDMCFVLLVVPKWALLYRTTI